MSPLLLITVSDVWNHLFLNTYYKLPNETNLYHIDLYLNGVLLTLGPYDQFQWFNPAQVYFCGDSDPINPNALINGASIDVTLLTLIAQSTAAIQAAQSSSGKLDFCG